MKYLFIGQWSPCELKQRVESANAEVVRVNVADGPLGDREEVPAGALDRRAGEELRSEVAEVEGPNDHVAGAGADDDRVVDAAVADHPEPEPHLAPLGVAGADVVGRPLRAVRDVVLDDRGEPRGPAALGAPLPKARFIAVGKLLMIGHGLLDVPLRLRKRLRQVPRYHFWQMR